MLSLADDHGTMRRCHRRLHASQSPKRNCCPWNGLLRRTTHQSAPRANRTDDLKLGLPAASANDLIGSHSVSRRLALALRCGFHSEAIPRHRWEEKKAATIANGNYKRQQSFEERRSTQIYPLILLRARKRAARSPRNGLTAARGNPDPLLGGRGSSLRET